ncbi:MAG TPA: hypothetical protein DHV86_07515 [Methylophilaceae bacterium]|nr:hypothetical protein [Methylophilaceae bacterium]
MSKKKNVSRLSLFNSKFFVESDYIKKSSNIKLHVKFIPKYTYDLKLFITTKEEIYIYILL